MKLSELKKQGVAGDGNERWVERMVHYNSLDDDGNEVQHSGTVMVRVTRWKDSRDVQKLGADAGDNVAALIHHNIRLDGGNEELPIAVIEQLNSSLINALLLAIRDVNPVKDLGKV